MNWLPIEGFDNYKVSDHGRVWSIPRTWAKGGLLKNSIDHHGYARVTLMTKGGKKHYRRVHLLVAAAFLGPRPAGLEVCHKDGDKANPLLSNLEYGTPSKNRHDAVAHGQHANSRKTHCPRDHPLVDGNLLEYRLPYRVCRTCDVERKARARLAAGHVPRTPKT